MSVLTQPISHFPTLNKPTSHKSKPTRKPSLPIQKSSISAPYSARPSRQSSTSSFSSRSTTTASSQSQPQTINLSQRATHILHTIYNAHAPLSTSPYIHPSASFTHEYVDEHSISGSAAYIQHWQAKLAKFPDFQASTVECAVDETQNKVWVVSDIICDSEGLRRRQVVDMLTFDGEGRLVEGHGFFRRMSAKPED